MRIGQGPRRFWPQRLAQIELWHHRATILETPKQRASCIVVFNKSLAAERACECLPRQIVIRGAKSPRHDQQVARPSEFAQRGDDRL
jgi:hypothetical protein